MPGNDPSFAQLRAFVAVAEELHFGRAAARLHMTQPPLSRTIRALEDGLGLSLFDRTSRTVALTPAGAAFLPEVRGILAQLQRAREAAAEVADGSGRTWRMGYAESAGFRVLPLLLAQFRRDFPSAAIELHDMHTLEQLAGLRARTLDVGLLRLTAAQADDIEVEYAYDDEVVLALPSDHRLQDDVVHPSELARESFIVYDVSLGGGLFTALLKVAVAAGFTPHVVQRATSTAMLMTLVAAGEGVAFVAEPVSMVPRPGVRFAHVDSPLATAQMGCAWLRGESNPTFRYILETARQHGGRPAAGCGAGRRGGA